MKLLSLLGMDGSRRLLLSAARGADWPREAPSPPVILEYEG